MVSNRNLDNTLKVLNKIKLKKEGVATLQAFFIFFFAAFMEVDLVTARTYFSINWSAVISAFSIS